MALSDTFNQTFEIDDWWRSIVSLKILLCRVDIGSLSDCLVGCVRIQDNNLFDWSRKASLVFNIWWNKKTDRALHFSMITAIALAGAKTPPELFIYWQYNILSIAHIDSIWTVRHVLYYACNLWRLVTVWNSLNVHSVRCGRFSREYFTQWTSCVRTMCHRLIVVVHHMHMHIEEET